jgi:hypothetical protein
LRIFCEETIQLSWKRTLALLLILGGLATFYFIKVKTQKKPAPTRGAEISSGETTNPDLYVLNLKEKEEINRFQLHDFSKKTAFYFEKKNEKLWQLTKPVNYPGEFLIIDGFTRLLKLSPRFRELDFKGLKNEEFGFDRPKYKICVSTNVTSKEKCLLIGEEAVAGGGRYAKWEDEHEFFIVGNDFVSVFDKSLYSVRKKQIFDLLENPIHLIQSQGSMFELEIRRQGKLWLLEKPKQAMIGPDAMNALLVQMAGLFVKEFVDGEDWQNSKFGLKKPAQVLRVLFENKSEEVLMCGNEVFGREAFYCRTSADATVFLISSGKLDKVKQASKSIF